MKNLFEEITAAELKVGDVVLRYADGCRTDKVVKLRTRDNGDVEVCYESQEQHAQMFKQEIRESMLWRGPYAFDEPFIRKKLSEVVEHTFYPGGFNGQCTYCGGYEGVSCTGKIREEEPHESQTL